MHVTADREEEDITPFFTKIIIFRSLIYPEQPDRFLFLLAQITRGDAAFQDMLRAIQNFLYFSNPVPPKNGLW